MGDFKAFFKTQEKNPKIEGEIEERVDIEDNFKCLGNLPL